MLTVREATTADLPHIANYWTTTSPAALRAMGADPEKIPRASDFTAALTHQLSLPHTEKRAYALIWEHNGIPVGHCNLNPISFAQEAFMHLHFWQAEHRQRGMGTELVRMSIPYFFREMRLQQLYCQPYALNPAPNRVLEKLGFELEGTLVTVPGSINFEQEVKRWVLPKARFEQWT